MIADGDDDDVSIDDDYCLTCDDVHDAAEAVNAAYAVKVFLFLSVLERRGALHKVGMRIPCTSGCRMHVIFPTRP